MGPLFDFYFGWQVAELDVDPDSVARKDIPYSSPNYVNSSSII